jgi:maleylpyruvate isomerase
VGAMSMAGGADGTAGQPPGATRPAAKATPRDTAAATARATAVLVDAATRRLLDTLDRAGADLVGPSALAGWTRGHVATHIARNADSNTWILDGAAVGEVREQYPGGLAVRAAAIDAGSGRPPAEFVDDVDRSAVRLAAAYARLDDAVWSRTIQPAAVEMPAAQLVWSRLREVEVHHADLDLGYGPLGWLPEFVGRELEIRVAGLAGRLPLGTAVRLAATDTGTAWEVGGGPASVAVAGPGALLLAWLIGRHTGDGLDAPAGLPPLGAW